MADAAYVVVPSRVFEGYPLVVAEAFGRGRAVLTVSGGSVGTIVDDETGWVVDPSAEALAQASGAITRTTRPLPRRRRPRVVRAAQHAGAGASTALPAVYSSL